MEIGQRVWVIPLCQFGTILSITQGREAIPVWGIDFAMTGVVHVSLDSGEEYIGGLDDLKVVSELR